MSLTFRSINLDASPEERLSETRTLFREYQASLDVDLGFQGFERELASLPAPYKHPDGELYLTYWNGLLAGCAGIKSLGDDVCELKRLYVRQAFRGNGIGRVLCEALITEAEEKGYRWMRLDTLARLVSAVSLYRKLGFIETEPYYDNPLQELVLYMERPLTPRPPRGIYVGDPPRVVERPRSRPSPII